MDYDCLHCYNIRIDIVARIYLYSIQGFAVSFTEERRLFYVAITRAKERLYLITEKYCESDFLKSIGRTASYNDMLLIQHSRRLA